MKVALIGSVSSSAAALKALIAGGAEITGVLGVDETAGRGISDYRSLRPVAAQAGIPFHAFVKASEPDAQVFLRKHQPDLLFVIGLSQLIAQDMVRLAPHGAVGFHPTMLPEGRGRAPVAWTILLGRRAAVNLFYLVDEPDAGDIIVQREVEVRPDDYAEDLIARTNEVLKQVIVELCPAIRAGRLSATPQDHSKATWYPKRTPADGLIDWTGSTDQVYRLVRAAGRPYPGAFARLDGQRVTIWRGRPGPATKADPGSVVQVEADGRFLVGTSDGTFEVTEAVSEAASWPGCLRADLAFDPYRQES